MATMGLGDDDDDDDANECKEPDLLESEGVLVNIRGVDNIGFLHSLFER